MHFCSACKDPDAIWDLLVENGCDSSICDKKGNPAAYYFTEHCAEIELPEMTSRRRKSTVKDGEYRCPRLRKKKIRDEQKCKSKELLYCYCYIAIAFYMYKTYNSYIYILLFPKLNSAHDILRL